MFTLKKKNQNIAKQRNLAKYFKLFSKKKDDKLESYDVNMRKIADYSFLLHDYETALSNYRQLLTDYKNAKDTGYLAGINEMVGLCYMLSGRSKDKDTEGYLDTALTNYSKIVCFFFH